jgi:hypothetical protein
VLQWLVEAAEQLRAFAPYCLRAVRICQGQLDELSAVLRAVKDRERSEDEARKRLSQSPHGVWGARDPVRKVL